MPNTYGSKYTGAQLDNKSIYFEVTFPPSTWEPSYIYLRQQLKGVITEEVTTHLTYTYRPAISDYWALDFRNANGAVNTAANETTFYTLAAPASTTGLGVSSMNVANGASNTWPLNLGSAYRTRASILLWARAPVEFTPIIFTNVTGSIALNGVFQVATGNGTARHLSMPQGLNQIDLYYTENNTTTEGFKVKPDLSTLVSKTNTSRPFYWMGSWQAVGGSTNNIAYHAANLIWKGDSTAVSIPNLTASTAYTIHGPGAPKITTMTETLGNDLAFINQCGFFHTLSGTNLTMHATCQGIPGLNPPSQSITLPFWAKIQETATYSGSSSPTYPTYTSSNAGGSSANSRIYYLYYLGEAAYRQINGVANTVKAVNGTLGGLDSSCVEVFTAPTVAAAGVGLAWQATLSTGSNPSFARNNGSTGHYIEFILPSDVNATNIRVTAEVQSIVQNTLTRATATGNYVHITPKLVKVSGGSGTYTTSYWESKNYAPFAANVGMSGDQVVVEGATTGSLGGTTFRFYPWNQNAYLSANGFINAANVNGTSINASTGLLSNTAVLKVTATFGTIFVEVW